MEKVMKRTGLLTVALTAFTLLLSSCSKDDREAPSGDPATLSLTVNMPGGDKVVYSKAGVQDAGEYAINSLRVYEYLVSEDETSTSLSRVLSYTAGGRENTVELVDAQNGSFRMAIDIASENVGRKYTYRLVANDPTLADPAAGSSFDALKTKTAGKALSDNTSASKLTEGGIAMSGTVKLNSGGEVITVLPGMQRASVALKRIVARVDVKYSTPNLKVTKIEAHRVAAKGYLFEGNASLAPAGNDVTLALNSAVQLPGDYLQNTGKTTENLAKAFYLYEHANGAQNTSFIRIEYSVVTPNGAQYPGSVDVSFRKTGGDNAYVNTLRNSLYTIVLGDGDKPITGGVATAKMVTNEWNCVELGEELDPETDPAGR